MRHFSNNKYSKYHSRKVKDIIGGGPDYDSQLEADRGTFLHTEEARGHIHNLQRQVDILVVPRQVVTIHQVSKKTGRPIKPKEKVIRPVTYRADFTYNLPDGRLVIEDAKGLALQEYIIKKKVLFYYRKIDIVEIRKPNQPIKASSYDDNTPTPIFEPALF